MWYHTVIYTNVIAGGSSGNGAPKGNDADDEGGGDGGGFGVSGGGKDIGKDNGGSKMSDEQFEKALKNAESGCHDTVLQAIDDVKQRKKDGEEFGDNHTCHKVRK